MRKDIDHLMLSQRQPLEHAVRVLREEFANRIKKQVNAQGLAKRICKIVLYGSFARGTPVRDMVTGYKSDYDLLVIVSEPALADPKYWEDARDALQRVEEQEEQRHPVNFIVHDLADVNDQLRRGRPFFRDVRRDGIILYEFSGAELVTPGNLSPEEELEEARMYFGQWFASSLEFYKLAAFSSSEEMLNKAAFNYHQAIEAAYHCVLLTLTLYSPKQHNIEKLRGMAEGLAPALIAAWPRAHYYERRPFNRLQRAYVEARYSPHYVITAEDLKFAAEQVATLQALVRQVCEERLARG